MSILGTLKVSGALPLNELNVRSSGSPEDLRKELESLVKEGLVTVQGELPEPDAIPLSDAPVTLTLAGLKQARV